MSKIEIVGRREYLSPTLEELQKWGKLHIETIPVADFARGSLLRRVYFDEEQCKEQDIREEVEKVFDKIVSHIPMEIYHDLNERLRFMGKGLPEIEPDQALSFAMTTQKKLMPLVRKQQDLMDERNVIVEYKKVAKMLLEVLSGHELERRWEIIGLTIRQEQSYVLSLLKEQLDIITSHNYAIFHSEPHNNRIAVVIGYDKHCADEVESMLFGTDIQEMPMPTQFRNRPLDVTLSLMEERLIVLPFKMEEIAAELRAFFLKNGVKVLLMRSENQDRLLRFVESSKFAQTKYTFMVRGWAPSDDVQAIRECLNDTFKGQVLLKEFPVNTAHEEYAPVVLKNPGVLRPFQRLVNAYALPMYGTVDPTLPLFVFFPIFFGMVLGDVGYGVLLAVFAGVIRARAGGSQILKDISFIALTFSVYSIIFGFLYGELFGVRLGLRPLLPQLARGHTESGAEVVIDYLILSIAFGVLHVLYGLVLGISVSFRKKDFWKVLEGFASILLLLGITLVVCNLIHFLPYTFFIVGALLLIVALPLLIYSGGLLAGLEISSLIGNILSYCRLMALGMASVYIVLVGDELDYLIENAVLGKLVLVIVHVFNLVLHIAVPTIHALRLHYVEFFTKFFVPGGRPFHPLKRTEITLDI